MHYSKLRPTDLFRKMAMIVFIALSAWGSILLAESMPMVIGTLALHLSGIVIACVVLPENEQRNVVQRHSNEVNSGSMPEPKPLLVRQ